MKKVLVIILAVVMALGFVACDKATPQEEINAFVEEVDYTHEAILNYVDILNNFHADTMDNKLSVAFEVSTDAAIRFAVEAYEMDEYQSFIGSIDEAIELLDDRFAELKEIMPKEAKTYFSAVEKEYSLFLDMAEIMKDDKVFFEKSEEKIVNVYNKIMENVRIINSEARKLK